MSIGSSPSPSPEPAPVAAIELLQDDDADADEKIYDIYLIHETIYKAVMMDNFGVPRVLAVSSFSISEPEVDKENKSVKIEATFTIKYRME
jgi:hypothetical protein